MENKKNGQSIPFFITERLIRETCMEENIIMGELEIEISKFCQQFSREFQDPIFVCIKKKRERRE